MVICEFIVGLSYVLDADFEVKFYIFKFETKFSKRPYTLSTKVSLLSIDNWVLCFMHNVIYAHTSLFNVLYAQIL